MPWPLCPPLHHQQQQQARRWAEQERLRAEQAEASQRAAVPRLLAMGPSVEQVAAALALPLEMVSDLGGISATDRAEIRHHKET